MSAGFITADGAWRLSLHPGRLEAQRPGSWHTASDRPEHGIQTQAFDWSENREGVFRRATPPCHTQVVEQHPFLTPGLDTGMDEETSLLGLPSRDIP